MSSLLELANIYVSYLILIYKIDENKRELAFEIFKEKRYLIKYSYGLKNKIIKLAVNLIGIKNTSVLYVKVKRFLSKLKNIK